MASSLKSRVSSAGLALIRSAVGFSSLTYVCPDGRAKIGYGHVLRPTEHFPRSFSREAAEMLLLNDLEPVEIYLNAVFPLLSQNEFDALASFCLSVGIGAFEKSTLFARLKAGDEAGAASQFGRWVHAGEEVLPELVKQRESERVLFLTPEAKPWTP